MKIRLLFLLVGALLLVPVFGQFVPVIEWQKNYGGSTYDAVTSLAYTSDGGCVVAGSSNSADGDVTNGHGSYDYWIVKADGSGTIEWQRSLGGSSYDIANSIAQTSDGGYIVAGYTESTDGDVTNNYGGSDYWVVKLNGSGMIEWERSLGGSGGEIARSIAQTSDGGYVVAGSSNSPDGDVTGSIGGGDFWIVKLDAAGIIEWDRSLGGSAVDAAYSIVQTSDGGYVTAGYTVSTNGDVTTNHGSYDFWVVKLDANGILEWQRSLGGSSFERAQTIVQTTDGGYVVAGSTHSMDGDVTYNYGGDADFWVVKLDGTGTVQWQSTFGGSALETAREVIQSNDGGYIVSGSSYSADGLVTNNNGSSDLWILKLDGAGNLEWQRTLGGSGIEAAASIVLASDGSYIVAGTAQSSDGDGTNNFGGQDFWVVKLTNDFNRISGRVFGDLNSNGLLDSGEPVLAHHNLHLDNGTLQTWSRSDGTYCLEVLELGTFVAEASPLTYYNPVPDSHSATFTAFQQADSLNNFAFQPIGIINDLVVSIAPKTGFRPNFVAQYIINYQNIGTTALLPTIELNLDPVLAYYEASITPTIVNPNSVSWELPELGPLTEGNIIVLVNVSQNAMNGSIVHSSVTIEPVIGDADVINNTAVWPVVVTGSYDPNDIQVDRIALALDELATPPDLNYLIRFQNTGTDTAFTVRVDDVLPPGLQFSSFQFVGSSHPMEIAYENSSNKLSFQFNNILLPDSNTNEAASHGYVWYRIKPVTTLVLGDSILNQAAIFFDFNEPVITNTAFTVIEAPNAISTVATPASFSVFPNPAKGSLIVTTAQIQRGTTLTLTDAFGREVLNERMNSTTHTLAVGELPRGVYMVTLRSGTSKEAQRVVLE